MTRILVINGHPDGDPARFCAALSEAYAEGARESGHEVRDIRLAGLDFPLVSSRRAFETDPPPPVIRRVQEDITWAEHIVLVHPLWLGGPPALLKGLFEQVFRYGFALGKPGSDKMGLLGGRSARIVTTMGMPSPVYRVVFGAFGTRAVERGIFAISGIRPIRRTLIGNVEAMDDEGRHAVIEQLRELGRDAR